MIRAWSSLLLGPLVITVLLTGCSSTGGVTVQEEALVPMLVEGKGGTPAAARADALQRATEKVVGAYIIAETSLEDDVIREEITSLSAGIVEGWDEIQMVQDEEGTYLGTYEVKVNTDPITSMLMTRSIRPTVNEGSGGAVEGREMLELALRKKEAAQVKAALREQFAEDAREAITILMEGFPKDYLSFSAEEVSPLTIVDTSADESVQVEAMYKATFDRERYSNFVEALTTLLSKIGKVADAGSWRSAGNLFLSEQSKQGGWKKFDYSIHSTPERGATAVQVIYPDPEKKWTASSSMRRGDKGRLFARGVKMRTFFLDEEIAQAMDASLVSRIKLILYGYGESGEAMRLSSDSHNYTSRFVLPIGLSGVPNRSRGHQGYRLFAPYNGLLIGPMPQRQSPTSDNMESRNELSAQYLPELIFELRWQMSHEAMEKLTRVEARVVIQASPQQTEQPTTGRRRRR